MPKSLAIHADAALLESGWADRVRIEVADGRIATVTVGAEAQTGDERTALLIPGLANLHSHAFQRAMAGLAEVRGPGEDSFWSWREAMYRIAARMDPDALLAIAALAYAEMLESGLTRVGEFHYLHQNRDGRPYADRAAMAQALVAAASESGMGLTLLPVFYAHSGFGGLAVSKGQRRFVQDLDGFARLHEACAAALRGLPDAVLGVAPHSLRAVTAAELDSIVALGGEGPIHIHVAEQQREVDDCLAWSARRPVEWLFDHAPVGRNWCLVHATHMTERETRQLAQSGAVAGLCPVTEASLGDGLFPLGAYLAEQGAFGIGSDSNVLIDAFEELRWLEYGQRLATGRRNVAARTAGGSTGEALFQAAGRGGAQALGAGFGLTEGESADLVSLDLAHPSLAACPAGQRLDALIFAAGRGAVDCVWRAGRKVVSGGRHHARDGIVARYSATLERLLA